MADPLNTLENVYGAVALLRSPGAWLSVTADGSIRAAAITREFLDTPDATKLDIGRCSLTALPAELGRLSKLEELVCSGNELTALPPELGQLSKLVWLNCGNNQLTELPIELSQLSALKILICGNNQLTSLPTEFNQLEKLAELHCSNNRLTALPAEFGRLSALHTLVCDGNPFEGPFRDLFDDHRFATQTAILEYLQREAHSSSRRVKAAKIAAPGR